ncbi:hypothetical protein TWF970_008277 [Orbilia oligospora]|uniref:Uncharacterized protein n=1 Tax=Orbilia oligospora TaxID=2813651 RepID=A0A7C8V272_ORBOL|nr:hypothetical protein TWF970_008277 [Orbilia oligospora]
MARSSRTSSKAVPAEKLTKKIVAQNLHESEPQVITSGAAAAIPLESNDHLFGSLGLNHRTLDLSEQGLPTTSFETLGGLKFAESFECISSTALQPAQSDTSKSIELQGQTLETRSENEQPNIPHSHSNSRKHARRREGGSSKGLLAKSVKDKLQPVDTTQLPGIPGDRILLSAVHRDASAEATLIADDREFTKSNLLNFEKRGALSSDYHVYIVKSTKINDSQYFSRLLAPQGTMFSSLTA